MGNKSPELFIELVQGFFFSFLSFEDIVFLPFTDKEGHRVPIANTEGKKRLNSDRMNSLIFFPLAMEC